MKKHRSLLTFVVLAILSLNIVETQARGVADVLPAETRQKLEAAHNLLKGFWLKQDLEYGSKKWTQTIMRAKGTFDALLSAAGSDPALLEMKAELLQKEGDDFLIKLAVIALEMREHPERIAEIDEQYVQGPLSRQELHEYYHRKYPALDYGSLPAVLRPRLVTPEHQKEEYRLAMEYHLIAPWLMGSFEDALHQLIYSGITPLKNPKSLVTLDEMAWLYSHSDDRIPKEIRDILYRNLVLWPNEQTFRILARHAREKTGSGCNFLTE